MEESLVEKQYATARNAGRRQIEQLNTEVTRPNLSRFFAGAPSVEDEMELEKLRMVQPAISGIRELPVG